jgi:methyltransferase (TIGR00027 family)
VVQADLPPELNGFHAAGSPFAHRAPCRHAPRRPPALRRPAAGFRRPHCRRHPWPARRRDRTHTRPRPGQQTAEDLLAHAVTRGVNQYVLLGAGLDTFAHRNPYPALRVFEVDHPATQQWKRNLLHSGGLPTPANLAYAPMDFERQSLPEQLHAAGFSSAAPAFFSWLGVVLYITLAAFRSTIRFISSQPSGSGVVFDYGQPRSVLTPLEQLAHDSLAARVHLAGEAFQLFFTRADVAAELAAFRELEDLGSPEINTRYFAGRSDGLKLLGSASRLVSAWT